MRPTDENQSPSTRPNLMSPRRTRTSGEDSILAMLEREPGHKHGTGASGARRAWYGAGASLTLVLIGTLVWLAANNDGARLEAQDSVLAEARQAPPQPATLADAPALPTAGAVLRQVAMAPAAETGAMHAAEAAVIVDQADQSPPAAAVPPLRMLKPAPEKAAPVRVPVPVAAAPARPVVKAAPPRPAAAAPLKEKALGRPAAAPAKPKPVMVAKGAVRPAPSKTQRGATAGKSTDGPVDPDVALISAVIVHANGHAPKDSQMTELLCPNDNCQARPPRQ